MKRVIKFRVWCNIWQKMYYPKDDVLRVVVDEYVSGYLIQCFEASDESCTIEKKDYHIMQFTGMFDKNGEEVYEGDVIKSIASGLIYVVVFKNGMYRGEQSPETMAWVHPHDFINQVIIGNIYDIPELLK